MAPEILTNKSGLLEIRQKVERNERLSFDDGLALYATNDIAALGEMADHANRRKNGLRVGYNVNRHINYSNLCTLSCMFCAYSKKRGDEGGYEFSIGAALTSDAPSIGDPDDPDDPTPSGGALDPRHGVGGEVGGGEFGEDDEAVACVGDVDIGF